jgi:quercetin dioxygenase-like cupin family protein
MRRIIFDGCPWLEPAEGVRCRNVELGDGSLVRLVEFAPGFRETNWCGRAHVGYVLAGRMEIEFGDTVEEFSIGDVLAIDAGDIHRARVLDGPVRLFLVEEA